jgi:ADP-ribosylglycohydrolase
MLAVIVALCLMPGVNAQEPSKESRMRGAFMGSLVADALTLGTHYEYDAAKIKQFYGEIDRYYAPGEKTGGETHGVGWGGRNFHGGNGNGPAKKPGEQTDYGDYCILILEYLASIANKKHRIELSELIPMWQNRLKTWRAWMCTQTKQTYQQVQQGTPYNQLGGMSNAMSLRIPAAFGMYDVEEDVVHASRAAMFTHRETTAQNGGEFFARVTFRVIHKGLSPEEAIKDVAKTSSKFIKDKVKQALDKATEAMDPSKPLFKEEFVDDLAVTSMARVWHGHGGYDNSAPIKVGKASPTEGTLPASIYFIVKYAGNFAAAAKSNSAVGGDNAARSIPIGMVMGAAQGLEGIPKELGKGQLVEWDHCEKLLNKLPLLKKTSKKGEL